MFASDSPKNARLRKLLNSFKHSINPLSHLPIMCIMYNALHCVFLWHFNLYHLFYGYTVPLTMQIYYDDAVYNTEQLFIVP